MLASTDGQTLLLTVGAGPDGALMRLRTSDGVVLDRLPMPVPGRVGLTVLPDGRFGVVTGAGSERDLWVVRLHPLERVRELRACEEAIAGIAVMRHGDRAFVTCRGDAVAEVDVASRRVVRTAALRVDAAGPCVAGSPALSRNETILFVPCTARGLLAYLDRSTLTVIDTLSLGGGPPSVVVAGSLALAPLPAEGVVALLDLPRREVLARLAAPPVPAQVVTDGAGRAAYVLSRSTQSRSAMLYRMDLTTADVVGSAEAGGALHIAAWPTDRTPVMRWLGGD